MRFRPLPILTAVTLVSLTILVLLGNWQYERYSEKTGTSPDALPPALTLGFDVLETEGARAQQVYGIADSEPVWRRFVPAQWSDTGELVLLGLDATGGANPVHVDLAGLSMGEQTVRIFPREGRRSGRNRPDEDVWYVFDRAGLLARYGLDDSDVPVAEPVDLTVYNADDLSRSRTTPNLYAAPKPIDPLPPQRHFGYALTWWGLALALAVMYVVFHHSRGRLRFKAER